MLKKIFGKSLNLLLVFVVSTLTSCSHIPMPDPALCVEMDIVSGRCLKVGSEQTFHIDETNLYMGKTWWELKPTMVYMPYPSWVELKTFIIKVCKKKLVDCDKSVSSWDRDIEVIDQSLEDKFKGEKKP